MGISQFFKYIFKNLFLIFLFQKLTRNKKDKEIFTRIDQKRTYYMFRKALMLELNANN